MSKLEYEVCNIKPRSNASEETLLKLKKFCPDGTMFYLGKIPRCVQLDNIPGHRVSHTIRTKGWTYIPVDEVLIWKR